MYMPGHQGSKFCCLLSLRKWYQPGLLLSDHSPLPGLWGGSRGGQGRASRLIVTRTFPLPMHLVIMSDVPAGERGHSGRAVERRKKLQPLVATRGFPGGQEGTQEVSPVRI